MKKNNLIILTSLFFIVNVPIIAMENKPARKEEDLIAMNEDLTMEHDRRDEGVFTKLHLAIYFKTRNCDKVKKLIEQGYNINAQVNYPGKDVYSGDKLDPLFKGYTPLHFAVQFAIKTSDIQIIWLLLKRGADFTIKDSIGDSPSDKALKINIYEIMNKVDSYTDLLFWAVKDKKYERVINYIKDIMNDEMSFILSHFIITSKEDETFLDFKNIQDLCLLLRQGAKVRTDLKKFRE